jgi:acyl carrier protein
MTAVIRIPNKSESEALSDIVKEIIHDKTGIDKRKLTNECNFRNDLNVDSLDFIDLTMEIEDQFNITITDEESETITTVGNLMNCVRNKKYKDYEVEQN